MESLREGFPKKFKAEQTKLMKAKGLVDFSPEDIAAHFRDHQTDATELLNESYDKRYSPASFITEENDGFKVGWYSQEVGYECVRKFARLTDAAIDYVMFSLGKGRWNVDSEH